MYSSISCFISLKVVFLNCRKYSSLRCPKKLSMGALSQQFPLLLNPGIVGGTRNPKEHTHRFYFVCFAMLIDNPILRFACASFRNSVWNFFSRSFSIRKRFSSACSSWLLLGRPLAFPNALTPSRRYFFPIPSPNADPVFLAVQLPLPEFFVLHNTTASPQGPTRLYTLSFLFYLT